MKPIDPNVFDSQALAGLKRAARDGQPSADTLKQVASQFEALFLQMMLKSMREASFGDDLFGSEQTEFYRDMYDQQLSVTLAKAPGPRARRHAGAPARRRARAEPGGSMAGLEGVLNHARLQAMVRGARRTRAGGAGGLRAAALAACRARRPGARRGAGGDRIDRRARDRLGQCRHSPPRRAQRQQPVRHQGRRRLERSDGRCPHPRGDRRGERGAPRALPGLRLAGRERGRLRRLPEGNPRYRDALAAGAGHHADSSHGWPSQRLCHRSRLCRQARIGAQRRHAWRGAGDAQDFRRTADTCLKGSEHGDDKRFQQGAAGG
ncbi:MAG: rod-binding protein [Chromatiales bacterium]|nr:rod-binding protein [Chromatiales bacterium]